MIGVNVMGGTVYAIGAMVNTKGAIVYSNGATAQALSAMVNAKGLRFTQ